MKFLVHRARCASPMSCNNKNMQISLRAPALAAFIGLAIVFLAPHAADAKTVTVTIKNMQYSPKSITVNPGDTITWINQDAMPHTVTENSGAFKSGTIAAGQSYSIQMNTIATRNYFCDFHSGMTGSISVVAPASTATTNTNTNTSVSTGASAGTDANAAALAAQAEALLLQVAAMQAQFGAPAGSGNTPTTVVSSSNCPLIGRVLKRGYSGDDVSRLQTFLAVDPSIYPEALVSGYYGALTEAAVKRWQTKYNIVSSGTAATTGYGVVGPRTAAAISLQCSTSTTTGGSAGTPTVGGFIQVSPVSGNTPLTVRVIATVNTVNSCAAANYTLDWGDGTALQSIPLPQGNCGQIQQTYSHVYLYGGVYTVRLAAGEHSTTATVVVSGASGPTSTTVTPQPTSGTISLTAPAAGQALSQPTTISWTSYNPSVNTTVGLNLLNASGTIIGSIATQRQHSSSYTWDGNYRDVDVSRSVFATPGDYRIRASLRPANFCLNTYRETQVACPAGSPEQLIAISDSGVVRVIAPFTYEAPGLLSGVSGNPLSVSITFNIPSSCAGYSLSWGDSSASVIHTHGTSCTQIPVTRTFTHTYSGAGTYTILLRRGSDLSRADSASVVISS